jgi:hypothetical protein
VRSAPRPPSRRAMGMPSRVVALQSVRGVPGGRGPVGCVCHGSDSVIEGTLSAHNRLSFNGAGTASGVLPLRRSRPRRRAGRGPSGSWRELPLGSVVLPRRDAPRNRERTESEMLYELQRDEIIVYCNCGEVVSVVPSSRTGDTPGGTALRSWRREGGTCAEPFSWPCLWCCSLVRGENTGAVSRSDGRTRCRDERDDPDAARRLRSHPTLPVGGHQRGRVHGSVWAAGPRGPHSSGVPGRRTLRYPEHRAGRIGESLGDATGRCGVGLDLARRFCSAVTAGRRDHLRTGAFYDWLGSLVGFIQAKGNGQPADPGPSSDILRFDMVFGGGMPPAEDWEYAYADGYAAALNARRRSDEALADDITDRKEAEADSVAEALAQAPSPPRKKKRR